MRECEGRKEEIVEGEEMRGGSEGAAREGCRSLHRFGEGAMVPWGTGKHNCVE